MGWPVSRRLLWPLAAMLLLVIYVVLVADLPSEVPASAYDDDLFIKQALSIKKGLWLGSRYNQFTLIKGSFHSVQLALASVLGLTPAFWLRCLYAFSVLSFCCLALPAAALWMRVCALACLLFDPWLISTYGGLRLLREATYIPFEIIALTASLFALDRLRAIKRGLQFLDWRIWLAFSISGLSLGCLLITREARIVVFLTAGLLLVLLFLNSLREHFHSRRRWVILMLLASLFLAFLITPLSSVRWVNEKAYGFPVSNEFEDGSFKSFYQDLISVKIPRESYKPWVPITQSALNTLRDLGPDTVLAQTINHLNPGWKEPGCGLRSDVCGEYAGGWFMWAWRSALFQLASPSDPGQFQELIKQSHQELMAICRNNPTSLDCNRSASGYLPWPSRWDESQGAFPVFFAAVGQHAQGLLLLDRFRQPFQYGPVTDQIKPAMRLGVELPPRERLRIKTLNHRIQQLRFTGVAFRWMMLGLASVWMLIRRRLIPQMLADPGCWLLAAFGLLQLLVLVLVQVSSFESTLYLTMVSPLLSMLVWRVVVMLKPVGVMSNSSLL